MKLEIDYTDILRNLEDRKFISSQHCAHFLKRGLQIISPHDLGLEVLGQYLPDIVVGASEDYIKKMKIPYHATSYIAAATTRNKGVNGKDNMVYIFKIPGKQRGGVPFLTGGTRKIGDNLFASTHRIILGKKATIVSADNFIINKDNIWNWKFFGKHFEKTNPSLYEDLIVLAKKFNVSKYPTHVVVARSDLTFKRLDIIDHYNKGSIAALNPDNQTRVIWLTNRSGYEIASKHIRESDLVKYIETGDKYDNLSALMELRKRFDIEIVLNDGGRQMSNGFRDQGLLGEERVTLEPFPGEEHIPDDVLVRDTTIILGRSLTGLDGQSELPGSLLLHSIPIGDERANVYLYPLDESQIL